MIRGRLALPGRDDDPLESLLFQSGQDLARLAAGPEGADLDAGQAVVRLERDRLTDHPRALGLAARVSGVRERADLDRPEAGQRKGRRLESPLEQRDADSSDARTDEVEPAGGGAGQIDDAPLDEGAPVVDPHAHALAALEAGDLDQSPQGQLAVRRRQEGGVVDLARGRGLALETVGASVPGGDALLPPSGGEVGRGRGCLTNGERTRRRAGHGQTEEKADERPPPAQEPHTRISAGRGWSTPSSAGSSSSRTKISTCSAARPTSLPGLAAAAHSSRVRPKAESAATRSRRSAGAPSRARFSEEARAWRRSRS